MGAMIKDIAAKVNVSTATNSPVPKNKPGTSESTRQKILTIETDPGLPRAKLTICGKLVCRKSIKKLKE